MIQTRKDLLKEVTMEKNPTQRLVSLHAAGNLCGMCYREGKSTDATHKVGEEIPKDAIHFGHNLTQYVCCAHFGKIVGQQSATTWRGCPFGSAMAIAGE